VFDSLDQLPVAAARQMCDKKVNRAPLELITVLIRLLRVA
jgi:hypothetical protein